MTSPYRVSHPPRLATQGRGRIPYDNLQNRPHVLGTSEVTPVAGGQRSFYKAPASEHQSYPRYYQPHMEYSPAHKYPPTHAYPPSSTHAYPPSSTHAYPPSTHAYHPASTHAYYPSSTHAYPSTHGYPYGQQNLPIHAYPHSQGYPSTHAYPPIPYEYPSAQQYLPTNATHAPHATHGYPHSQGYLPIPHAYPHPSTHGSKNPISNVSRMILGPAKGSSISQPVYMPQTSNISNYPVKPAQPSHNGHYSPHLYTHIHGQKQPKESQRRITYHPYTRTYTDYEERIMMVPIEKTKVSYYQKIYQTDYVPQAVEETVMETMPVQKSFTKVQYVPVEQKIIHFPIDDRNYIIPNEEIQALKKKAQIQKGQSQLQISQNKPLFHGSNQPFQPLDSEKHVFPNRGTLQPQRIQQGQPYHQSQLAPPNQPYQQTVPMKVDEKDKSQSRLRESFVKQVYTSNHGEKERYKIQLN